MPKLETLIADWRKKLIADANLTPDAVDELEDHLRENLGQFFRAGLTESEAFKRAVQELGATRMIATEFQKLDQPVWLPVKVINAIGMIAALAIITLVISRFGSGGFGLLLTSHVLFVTFGYTTTFLIG